jgi:Mce-associated membrane protein
MMAEDTVSVASRGWGHSPSNLGAHPPEGQGESVATRESESASKPVRRRASRAAGPATGTASSATDVSVEAPKPVKVRISRPGPPPRRQPHRALVAWVSLATVLVAAAVTGVFAWLAFDSNRHTEAAADRQQRFVDTA